MNDSKAAPISPIFCILINLCAGSVERFIGIHMLVYLSWRNKTMAKYSSRNVLGSIGRSNCYHDCDGMLWRCSSYITNEFHIFGSIHIGAIIYAWHNDITSSSRYGCFGRWCNSSRLLGINIVCITNKIRFYHVQWRFVCRIDTIHALWFGRNVFPAIANSSSGLCIAWRIIVQCLFDLWVSKIWPIQRIGGAKISFHFISNFFALFSFFLYHSHF